MSKIEIHFNFGSLRDVLTPKPPACFLSVEGNLMPKMLHEYFFDMQLFKNSEFGWVENQYHIMELGTDTKQMHDLIAQ